MIQPAAAIKPAGADCIIDESRLNQREYFLSLTEAACRCGLLSEKDMTEIKRQLLEILKEMTDAWNQGESSSVRVEQARDFLTSVLFVTGMQLKAEPSADRAVETLKKESLRTCFEKGMKRVDRKISISRIIQRRISGNLFSSQNIFFGSTFIDGIDGFFRLYRPGFAAHEVHITADYPLCAGRPDFDGIEFIEQYLSCGEAENLFLRCFDAERVHYLMKKLTPEYEEIPMNLFEPVFLTALGIVLNGNKPETLMLTEGDLKHLYALFAGKSFRETEDILRGALNVLCETLPVPQLAHSYGMLCIPRLAPSVCSGVSYQTLDRIFVKKP